MSITKQTIVLLLLLIRAALGAIDEPTHQNIEKFVPEVVRLLEAKQYPEVIRAILAPTQLAEITKNVSLEKFAAQFGEKKAPQLLVVLNGIKGSKPVLSENGSVATFKVPDEIKSPKRTVVFKQIDKKWYLQN